MEFIKQRDMAARRERAGLVAAHRVPAVLAQAQRFPHFMGGKAQMLADFPHVPGRQFAPPVPESVDLCCSCVGQQDQYGSRVYGAFGDAIKGIAMRVPALQQCLHLIVTHFDISRDQFSVYIN